MNYINGLDYNNVLEMFPYVFLIYLFIRIGMEVPR